MRRTLCAVIFDKVINLSMKSLAATNSGKLVSVISADLFSAERSLAFTCLLLAFPFVNAFTYVIIGVTSSWYNSLIVIGVWLSMLLIQYISGKCGKFFRIKVSALSDERLKLVSDMVVGIRTLKSFGWENHYKSKIEKIRKTQHKYQFVINFSQTLG